jgi:hypothetical protein
MANNYYIFSPAFVPGAKVRSDEVNAQYTAIEQAFDLLPSDSEAITNGTTYVGVESGSGNSYIVTLPDVRTALQEGDHISFLATHTNTGASQINVDGLGLITLVHGDGTAMAAGDLVSGLYYEAIYTVSLNRWQLTTPKVINSGVIWAQDWAITPEDTPVPTAAGGNGTTDFSALHWAAKAEDEKDLAAIWAANASSFATTASNAADAAVLDAAAADSSATDADNSAIAAAASAAGVNLPSIIGGDAGKQLKVNVGETGYELYNILATNNTWVASQQFDSSIDLEDDVITLHADISGGDARVMQWRGLLSGSNLPYWDFRIEQTTESLYLEDNNGTQIFTIDQAAAPFKLTATQLLFNSIDVQRAATPTTTGLVERATNGEVVTGTDTTRYVAPLEIATNYYNRLIGNDLKIKNHAYFNSEVNLGDSGAANTCSWTDGNKQKVTLTGNVTYTFNAPSGPTNLIFRTIQNGTGGYVVTFPATVHWPGGTAPTIPVTAAGTVDIFAFYWDGTNYHGSVNQDSR